MSSDGYRLRPGSSQTQRRTSPRPQYSPTRRRPSAVEKDPTTLFEIPRSASGQSLGRNQEGLKSLQGQFRRSKVLMPLCDPGIRIDTLGVNMSYDFHTCHTSEGANMRIWSFVQQKGGSGKSTICTNVAVHAEEKGETVLIVDLDPQSSASLWHLERGTNKP